MQEKLAKPSNLQACPDETPWELNLDSLDKNGLHSSDAEDVCNASSARPCSWRMLSTCSGLVPRMELMASSSGLQHEAPTRTKQRLCSCFKRAQVSCCAMSCHSSVRVCDREMERIRVDTDLHDAQESICFIMEFAAGGRPSSRRRCRQQSLLPEEVNMLPPPMKRACVCVSSVCLDSVRPPEHLTEAASHTLFWSAQCCCSLG
eukprot:1466796-Amphidinium_carterae.1